MNPEAFKKQQNERIIKSMLAGMRIAAYQNGATNVTYGEARAANQFLLLEEAKEIVEKYQKEGM